MKTKTTTRKTAKKTSTRKPKSSLQIANERELAKLEEGYIDAVENLTDEEVWKAIQPKGKVRGKSISMDAATDTIQYNDPIPSGAYREVPPSHFIGMMQGLGGRILRHLAVRNFNLGKQINGWTMQNCFIYKACAMPGDDAVACGYEIVPHGTKAKQAINEFKKLVRTEDFNLNASMREFECFKRAYGGAILIPSFEEEVDMSKPLSDYAILKGKTFLGWTCVEPYYIQPDFDNNPRALNDPSYKHYLVPTHWNVSLGGTTKKIHRSWIIFRRNVMTAKIYQPQYQYLGPSIPQMVLERLYAAEICANEAAMLMRSKRSFAVEADIRKLVANPEYAKQFIQNMTRNRDNHGIAILPEGSNAKQMDTYLTECMPLTMAQYGILCAEVEIPAPKFMMAQLTGFANSGNYEIKLYAQNVKRIVKDDLEPIVRRTLDIFCACKGIKDCEYEIEFGDVDIPTVVEQAEIKYEESRAAKFEAEAKAIKNGNKTPNNHHTQTENVK